MTVDVEAMIAARGDETIEHAGVKGMKWGVRRYDVTLNGSAKNKKTVRAIKSSGKRTKSDLKTLRQDMKQGKLLFTPSQKKTYNSSVVSIMERNLNAELGRNYGNAAPRAVVVPHGKKSRSIDVHIIERSVKHSDINLEPGEENTGGFVMNLVFDAEGLVVDFDIPGLDETLAQSLIVDMQSRDILAHYGIKGMRWGVRRSDRQLAKAKAAADELAARRGSESGGVTVRKGRVHSSDSATAADLKSIAKTYGSSALTNADLQTLNTRMNLERQYAQLNPPQKSRLQRTLDGVGKAAQVNKKLGNPAGKAAKALIDKQTAGSATKTSKAARAAAAAAAATTGAKKPGKTRKEKASSNITSSLPSAGSNLDFTFDAFDSLGTTGSSVGTIFNNVPDTMTTADETRRNR